MEKVKFGFSQLFKRTPEFAKLLFRIILYITAIIMFLMNLVTEIPEPIKTVVNKYCIYFITTVHFLSKMFGIEVKEPKTKEDE